MHLYINYIENYFTFTPMEIKCWYMFRLIFMVVYNMKYLAIILMMQVFIGCTGFPDDVQQSLELAGDNRPELEEVLKQYSNDSLKYVAAEYLISYLPYYNYQEVLPEFEPVFDSLAQVPVGDDAFRKSLYIQLLDSVTDKGQTRAGITKFDIQEVSADYLIENIELAFEAWQDIPAGKRADFETFCNYILPYRNWDEPLEPGVRKYLKDKYKWVPKLLNQGIPVKSVIDSVLVGFRYRYVGEVRNYYPTTLSVRQFDRSHLGLCQDAVNYFTHVFRSVGLACSNEYLPQWGTHHTNGHSWLYFQYGDQEFALDAGGDGLDVREKYIGESIPKVYRRTYAQLNPSSLFREGRDVTDFYRPVIDFEMEVGDSVPHTSVKYTVNVYHATKLWSPVAEMIWEPKGPDHSSRLVCHDLGVNTLYIAGRWEDGKVYPVTKPFFVQENGDIHEFTPDETLLDSVPLLRKYGLTSPRSRTKAIWIRSLDNGSIQGAQDSSFTNADTLFKITNFWSTHLRSYPVHSNKAYRYVRFTKENCGSYLAELAFYDKVGRKLEGKVISKNIVVGTNDSAVFDGNPLTWTGGTNFYVGYDFGRPVQIHSIAFQARNDDNHIRLGDEYELKYWDQEWKSLGRQIAQDTVIYFNEVPKNVLMLLKDHTRGSEEIPFRINDEKAQEWMGFDNY